MTDKLLQHLSGLMVNVYHYIKIYFIIMDLADAATNFTRFCYFYQLLSWFVWKFLSSCKQELLITSIFNYFFQWEHSFHKFCSMSWIVVPRFTSREEYLIHRKVVNRPTVTRCCCVLSSSMLNSYSISTLDTRVERYTMNIIM